MDSNYSCRRSLHWATIHFNLGPRAQVRAEFPWMERSRADVVSMWVVAWTVGFADQLAS